MEKAVLPDFANYDEYKKIKGIFAFSSLEEHRKALEQTKKELEKQGFKVEIVLCDLNGYFDFLKRRNLKNSPQNVTTYICAKAANLSEDDEIKVIDDTNIAIIKDI